MADEHTRRHMEQSGNAGRRDQTPAQDERNQASKRVLDRKKQRRSEIKKKPPKPPAESKSFSTLLGMVRKQLNGGK